MLKNAAQYLFYLFFAKKKNTLSYMQRFYQHVVWAEK